MALAMAGQTRFSIVYMTWEDESTKFIMYDPISLRTTFRRFSGHSRLSRIICARISGREEDQGVPATVDVLDVKQGDPVAEWLT